jgi:hypothetical protein
MLRPLEVGTLREPPVGRVDEVRSVEAGAIEGPRFAPVLAAMLRGFSAIPAACLAPLNVFGTVVTVLSALLIRESPIELGRLIDGLMGACARMAV